MEQDRGVCFEEYLVGLCQGYEEIGPSRENAQSRNKWRKRIWGEAGQPDGVNIVHLEKMATKMAYMCVSLSVQMIINFDKNVQFCRHW